MKFALLALVFLAGDASAQSLNVQGRFASPGTQVTLYASSASSSTYLTNAAALIVGRSFVVPANTLKNNGDALDVFCVTAATSTSAFKQVEVSFGANQTTGNSLTGTSSRLAGKATIYRVSSTTASWFWQRETSVGNGNSAAYLATLDFTADITISCDIWATTAGFNSLEEDGNMRLKYMRVTLHPAP